MKRMIVSICILLCLVIVDHAEVLADEKPSFEFNMYGKVKLDGAFDNNLTSHGNFVMWVNPQEYGKDDEQYNMTANETRFGIKIAGKGYKKAIVNGNIEFDLFAGVSGGTIAQNKAMLQLRHAYFTIEMGNTKLLAGQSWDLFSPLNPSTLNYPVLWGCGNTGYRRPQFSLWHTFNASEKANVTVAGGFFRTIGNDLTPTFTLATGEESEGSDDGTDAGIPSFQGRLDTKYNFDSGASMRFGVSGLWGQLKAETNLGGYEKYESWGVVGHFMFAMASGIGFSGEFYTGSNLGSYFGGILNSSTVDGVSSSGGWASAWAKVSPKIKLSSGVGLDDPKNEDIGSGRARNFTVFGNVKYDIVPNVTIGFEVAHWNTEYKDVSDNIDDYSNFRAQTSFILAF